MSLFDFKSVAWSDGRPLGAVHLQHMESYLENLNRWVLCRAFSEYGFFANPPQNEDYAQIEGSLVSADRLDVRICVHHCCLITGAGDIIEVTQPLRLSQSISLPPKFPLYLLIHVNSPIPQTVQETLPNRNKSEPQPKGFPPEMQIRERTYLLSLSETPLENPHVLAMERILIDKDKPIWDETYLPPCFQMTGHPRMKNLFEQLRIAVKRVEDCCVHLYSVSHSVKDEKSSAALRFTEMLFSALWSLNLPKQGEYCQPSQVYFSLVRFIEIYRTLDRLVFGRENNPTPVPIYSPENAGICLIECLQTLTKLALELENLVKTFTLKNPQGVEKQELITPDVWPEKYVYQNHTFCLSNERFADRGKTKQELQLFLCHLSNLPKARVSVLVLIYNMTKGKCTIRYAQNQRGNYTSSNTHSTIVSWDPNGITRIGEPLEIASDLEIKPEIGVLLSPAEVDLKSDNFRIYIAYDLC